jgi:hypothetical protein
MKNEAYKTETVEQHGITYRVDYLYDPAAGKPWENSDAHGPVSDWERRDKRPGELVLNEDNRGYKRFYDFKKACQIALRDGWDSRPYNDGTETKRQQAARAARADFEFLRRWCNDEWFYIGIVVTEVRTDSDGFTYDGFSSSLWGIESDNLDSHPIVQDLIGDIEHQRNHGKAA